jgi:Methyltransferase FkbM domain
MQGRAGVRRANKMKSGLVSAIKTKLVPDESSVRPVLFGIFKGLRFDINLRSQTQLYLGLWERETFDTIRRASRSAEWFVDIGAGQGELCTLFATLRHVRRVVAIEPIEPAVIALRANLHHNSIHLDRVELFRKFVGTKKSADHIEIDQLGINLLVHGLIKIDVDGSEFDVLQSGKNLFSQGKVDVLVETHSLELEEICIDWLRKRGYSCTIIKNAWWRSVIPEQRPGLHNRWFFATRSS